MSPTMALVPRPGPPSHRRPLALPQHRNHTAAGCAQSRPSGKEQEGSRSTRQDLVSEVTRHHFHHVSFISVTGANRLVQATLREAESGSTQQKEELLRG